MSYSASNYVQKNLPAHVVEKLEAGAFRSLRQHLEERSGQVANIDLMTLSGFCRNCLAKWMVLEARRLVDDSTLLQKDASLEQALNAMGYDEAAQYVYGCDYKEWKQRYTTKATDEQMKRYKESEQMHAKHDKNLLKIRAEKPTVALNEEYIASQTKQHPSDGLMSNVCCQKDVDEAADSARANIAVPTVATNTRPAKKTRAIPAYIPPPPPSTTMFVSMCVLTVSDRASQNLYETGDLSGPAVEKQVQAVGESLGVKFGIVEKIIVADDVESIQQVLKKWSNRKDLHVDLVLTTGGTGFGQRDVTPEATAEILDRECMGIMSFVTTECGNKQPLASLSRGTAGVLQNTLIVNLPGNPKGIGEILPILLPVLLHAIHDLQTSLATH